MPSTDQLLNSADFAEALFVRMKPIAPALENLEIYEFRYCLDNLTPKAGWKSVTLDNPVEIEKRVNSLDFYKSIQFNHKVDGKIVLDEHIISLAQMLFVGLVTGAYEREWINTHFYFDVRGFYFLHRTEYFTEKALSHFGGKPFASFESKQKRFEHFQSVGYKEFKAANAQVDDCFFRSTLKLIDIKKTPVVIAIAGATAAGKTEIVERLSRRFEQAGRHVTSVELDNFLTDRDYREAHGIHSEGKQALHFDIFIHALEDITHGKKISTPRYNFINGMSSHDPQGNLKPDGVMVEIEPADIIFLEGNFPFLLDEVLHLIGIKVVYLTDDPVRLKRKWKRDMDYRKKYDLNYFRNRYFRDQFIMAHIAYIPQIEVCDLTVDTTGAALWASKEIKNLLGSC